MGFYVVQCLSGLAQASSLFLVAAGLSIIFGVTRIVNFAHGSFYSTHSPPPVRLGAGWRYGAGLYGPLPADW
jgi:branched-chain amino acid transport system permease protein